MILTLVDAVAGYAAPVSPPATLSVARGEVVGLAGSNGIGKSTLLKAVLGTARSFSGSIELLATLGADRLPPPARLAEKLGARIDRLSGGEYQLLMLWATLAGESDLILLDEPTNNLDASHIRVAIEEIAAASARRATLVVSHDRDFLAAVCTRIVVLEATGG